jgi:hypothetical protein
MIVKALSGASAALLLAWGAPAAAQNSDTPIDVTAAPAPSADTIGPSQLQNFNLQGTVTRPAERPAASSPQPAATPQPSSAVPVPADAGSSISPNASSNRTTESRARPARPADARPSFDARTSRDNVTPSLPLDVTTNQAPQPSYDGAVSPGATPLSPDNSFFSWPWLAALAALIGGGAYIGWSRRGRRQRHGDPGRLAFAGLVPDAEAEPAPFPPARPRPDPVPARAQPAPRPDPVPPPAPKPAPKARPADDGLIVSTGLKPVLNVEFQPDRAVVTESEVLLQFDVTLTNSGSAPARDVLVEGRLVCAHAGQDQEIAAFFHEPQATGDRMAGIPPLGKVALKSAVRLPLDQLHSFEVEGRTLFVPLVAFNILFRSGSGDGQASASYLVGRGNDEDEKLAPFRLDLGPRIFRGLSARPHSMGLTR